MTYRAPTHRALLTSLALVPLPLALALALTGCGTADAPPEEERHEPGVVTLTTDQLQNAGVTTQEAVAVSRASSLELAGTVQPPDTARVVAGSFVEGRVVRVLVVEGDRVRAGAPLVRIHSHELADWQRELSAAEARVAQARAVAERGDRLHAGGAISTEERERRQVALAVAEADLRRAQEIVDHLNPDQGDVVILAPRAGVVHQLLVSQGEAVVPGDPLVELGTTDVLWVVAGLPETAAAEVEVGTPARVTFSARPGLEATGRVVGLGVRVDPRLRTTALRVQLDSVPAGIRSGMLATVAIAAGEARTGVLVPDAALQRAEPGVVAGVEPGEEAGTVVFLDEGGGRFRALPVRILARGPDGVLVDGIPPGSQVVVTGAYTLRAVLEGFLGAEGPE